MASFSKKPDPFTSVKGAAFNMPLPNASSFVLNNHPFDKPMSAIWSRAFFCDVLAIILPVVCNKEDLRFFSSPSNFLIADGSSSPVTNLISSKPSFLVIVSKALNGSAISYLAVCIISATFNEAYSSIASSIVLFGNAISASIRRPLLPLIKSFINVLAASTLLGVGA